MDEAGAYYRRLNRPLLNILPPGLGSVLDVGCAAGELGRAYKDRHPGSRWTGIELDADAAALAVRSLDHVETGDAEALGDDSLPGAPFDALIYADTLEHFRDPTATLTRHLRLLKPGGVVCASLPNIQHWSAILSLIGGRWDYRDEGLFDRTHLRFFTLSTIVDFFRGCGCVLEFADPLIPRPGAPLIPHWDRHDAFLEELERLCGTFGLAFDRRRFQAYQYVVRARRERADG